MYFSPNLFNIFTRDLPGVFQNCDPCHLKDKLINCLMYADDTILVSESRGGSSAGIKPAVSHPFIIHFIGQPFES